jgi:alpha-tubulin suppressor-like RCC1 family protein
MGMRTLSGFGLVALALLAVGCLNPNESHPSTEGSRRLAAGASTACALDPSGKVFCWGLNSSFFEYGTGALSTSATPIEVPVPPLTSISSGWGQHKCGLADVGAVCWGRGASGQIGNATLGAAGNPPTNVAVQEDWRDISTGRLTTCAVNAEGDAFCWGLNQNGVLGDTLIPLGARQTTPNRVVGGVKFASVVAGWIHTCGISTAGTVYCWGDNTTGQLGIGTTDADAHAMPVPVASTLQFRKIALSARSTCAVTVDDQLLCWGYNGTGQLGDGTTTTRDAPTTVALARKWKDVSVSSGFVEGTAATAPAGLSQGGAAHACAVDDAGAVYCWGWNAAGQLGDGSRADQLAPTPVNSTVHFSSVALGSAYSCAMSGTAIYCWGSNAVGQLGAGSALADATQPVRVLTGW